MKNSRRDFIKKVGVTSLATLVAKDVFSTSNTLEKPQGFNKTKGLTILFQGDSITDGNRTRDYDWNHVMGHGYAYLIASRLWFDYPEENLQFFNRGISGNTVTDLDNRWQEDTLDLKPDIVSILVGINDVNFIVDGSLKQTIEEFENSYRKILDRTKKELPDSKIILCEPFILPLGRVDNKPEVWEVETKNRREVVLKLAKEYDTCFVELQKPFIDKCKVAPAKYWIWDGIHPMPAGHELIAQQWLTEAKKIINFLK